MSRKRKTVNRRRVAPAAGPARVAVPGVTIRTAGVADLDRVRDLCAPAGIGVPDEIAAAVRSGSAGAALYAGQVGGTAAFFRDVRDTLPDLSAESLRNLFRRLTLVLVAEHASAGVVGAALARPPVATITEQLRSMQSSGSPARDQMEVALGGALRVSRIRAVGVDGDHRRRGVGTTLVEAAVAPFAGMGYSLIYGIVPAGSGLAESGGGLGFTALPAEAPLSLERVGVRAEVRPGPGEQVLYRDK